MKQPLILIVPLLILTACAAPNQPAALAEAEPAATLAPSPTPFPMENGVFTGGPDDFLITEAELGGLYTADGAGTGSTNMDVLQARADGDAYIEATGRIMGWHIQFNRTAAGSTPPYIVNVVNTYETAEGAQLVLSPEWHQDVWSQIDSGGLTRLPDIEGLDAEQLVWQTADGAVGVEIVYRNLYIFMTGPSDGSDQYAFFADLAKAHLDWIKAGE